MCDEGMGTWETISNTLPSVALVCVLVVPRHAHVVLCHCRPLFRPLSSLSSFIVVVGHWSLSSFVVVIVSLIDLCCCRPHCLLTSLFSSSLFSLSSLFWLLSLLCGVWCVVVGTMGLVGDDGGCGTTSVMCQCHTDAHCWPRHV